MGPGGPVRDVADVNLLAEGGGLVEREKAWHFGRADPSKVDDPQRPRPAKSRGSGVKALQIDPVFDRDVGDALLREAFRNFAAHRDDGGPAVAPRREKLARAVERRRREQWIPALEGVGKTRGSGRVGVQHVDLAARGQLLNLLRTGFDDPHAVGFRVGKEPVLKDAGESQGDLLAEKGQLLGECGHVGLDAPKGCRPVCVHDDAQRLFPPQATPRFVKTQGSVF